MTDVTMEQARHQANANAKADRLYEKGYRAEWLTGEVVAVTTPKGGTLILDLLNRECTCSGYANSGFCSHLLGIALLLRKQGLEAYRA